MFAVHINIASFLTLHAEDVIVFNMLFPLENRVKHHTVQFVRHRGPDLRHERVYTQSDLVAKLPRQLYAYDRPVVEDAAECLPSLSVEKGDEVLFGDVKDALDDVVGLRERLELDRARLVVGVNVVSVEKVFGEVGGFATNGAGRGNGFGDYLLLMC